LSRLILHHSFIHETVQSIDWIRSVATDATGLVTGQNIAESPGLLLHDHNQVATPYQDTATSCPQDSPMRQVEASNNFDNIDVISQVHCSVDLFEFESQTDIVFPKLKGTCVRT